MSPEFLTLLMFGTFFLMLALGVPLAWTTGGVGIAFAFLMWGSNSLSLVVLRVWDVMGSFSLLAAPLFVLMGNLLLASDISNDLFRVLHSFIGRIRGGLGVATIGLCCVTAAMVGTVGADVTITALIALPYMLKAGYDKHMALGSIVAGGALGVLIPPSIMFIIYGVTVGESIGKLFMGGIGPGVLFAGLYIGYILIKCHLNPSAGPPPPKEKELSFIEKLKLLKSLALPVFLILFVMGSIFAGIATPGEAAGIGVLGSIICALIKRRLTWKALKQSLYDTMKTCGILFWIVFGAMTFIAVFSLGGGSEFVKEFIMGLELNRWAILIIMQLVILALGMVLDSVGITVLLAPIMAPIVKSLGFNPLWFGVIFNLNIQIAYCSPPFGYSMFYLKAVAPDDVTMRDLYRSVLPYIGLQLLGMAICMIFPQIILWLPSVLSN